MARVCVIREHYVPQDSRVARDVAALVELGHHVDVVCLRAPGQPRVERKPGQTIWRLPLSHSRGRRGLRYVGEYGAFFVMAGVFVAALHARHRYQLVQVHSLPDALVFAAAVPRLTGARVLLDLQECMPEFFATKFGVGPGHRIVRAIARMEQASIRFGHAVITPTAQMRDVFVGRGADPARITVVMDGADERVFHPVATPGGRTGFTLVSHGTIEEHYGLDTVIEAVGLLRHEIPELRLCIYGDGADADRLRNLVTRRHLGDRVVFSDGFVPLDELVAGLAAADVGVVAMRRDPFRDVSLPGKVFDFVAMGKPVLSSRTRSVEETFGSAVALFESGDAVDLARAIRRLHADPAYRADLAARASATTAGFQWSRQRQVYGRVVCDLLGVVPVPQLADDPGQQQRAAADERA